MSVFQLVSGHVRVAYGQEGFGICIIVRGRIWYEILTL